MKGVSMAPRSTLATNLIKSAPTTDLSLEQIEFYGLAHSGLSEFMADWKSDNRPNFMRGLQKVKVALDHGLPHFYGRLWVKHIAASGEVTDYGLVSMRVVTTVGVNYIANCFAGTASYEPENMKYHGIGTGTTAEATGDTNLVTPLTTNLNPNNTRATGTTTIGGSSNVYRTVGTNTVDPASSINVTEHGIFDQASTTSGTLLDRSVFSAIAMSSGDSLQTTYELTFTAGS